MNGAVSPALSALDARVLRATDAGCERSPEKGRRTRGLRGGRGAVCAASASRRLPRRGRRRAAATVASHPSRRCRAGATAVSRVWEGSCSLSANRIQADDCFGAQRVERASAARTPAAAGRSIVRAGADVARRAVAGGQALLERGLPLPVGRAARPVHISGGLCGWAQPHDLRAADGAGARSAARRAHPAQRGAASGDLADQPGAAQAAGAWVMASGRDRGRGGCGAREHGRVRAAGGWDRW
jgi:hypothetical protein